MPRELGEEIGFVDGDITSQYTKLLEINICSPAISQTKLIEDTHAWGPDETRRRGKYEIKCIQ